MNRFFLRTLATKPPVPLFGIQGTYANALYLASVEASSVEQSFQGLAKVHSLIKEDPKVGAFLTNPALSRADRSTVIDTVAQNLKLDKTVTNFLSVLSENNRLGEFDAIYKDFSTLYDASRGVVEATITSAKPLDQKVLKKLQAAIQKLSFVGDGKQLKVSNVVNGDILGGVIVDVGDKTVDLSIASKVAKLNLVLGEAV